MCLSYDKWKLDLAHNFAYAMSLELFWNIEKCDLITSSESKAEKMILHLWDVDL